jgi:surfactin synthase thioesterase subunit
MAFTCVPVETIEKLRKDYSRALGRRLEPPPEVELYTEMELTLFFQSAAYLKVSEDKLGPRRTALAKERAREAAGEGEEEWKSAEVVEEAPLEPLRRWPELSKEDKLLWFPLLSPRREIHHAATVSPPKLRVFLFPAAGTAAGALYRQWPADDRVEVCAVQLPGHETRFSEPCLRSCADIAETLLPVVAPLVQDGVPYVFFGHSVGTWMAYELLVRMQAERLPMPRRFFVSSFLPPTTPEDKRPWKANAGMGDEAFKNELRGWDVNEQALKEGLWEPMKEMLRADCCCFDEYVFTHADKPALRIPLTLLYAVDDQRITREHLSEWTALIDPKDAPSGPHRMEGHHLFVYTPPHRDAAYKLVHSEYVDQCL